MGNNNLGESEIGNDESEIISDCGDGNRKLWVTAKEIAGLEGFTYYRQTYTGHSGAVGRGKEGGKT